MVQNFFGRTSCVLGLSQYDLRNPALSACGKLPVIAVVGMEPLLSGCLGSVRQKSHPMEQPCDHQRQGCPPPPFSLADPRSQGPLLAQEQLVPVLLVPFWKPSTTRSKALRLTGMLGKKLVESVCYFEIRLTYIMAACENT